MWRCKHCGGEVTLYQCSEYLEQRHKIDKNGNIVDTTIIRNWEPHLVYECIECEECSKELEELAKWEWAEGEEEMNLKKELEETLKKLEELSRLEKTFENNLLINALNTYVNVLQLKISAGDVPKIKIEK